MTITIANSSNGDGDLNVTVLKMSAFKLIDATCFKL